MGGGGDKQKPSRMEKIQAQRARARMKEWEDDGYKELETQGIARAKRDYTAAIGGMTSADLNQAAVESDRGLGMEVGQGTLGVRTAQQAGALQQSQSAGLNSAMATGQDIQNQARLGMAKVGQDVSLQTDNMFASAAQRGASQAQQAVANDNLRSRARTNALVQGVTAGVIGAKENPGMFSRGTAKSTLDNAEQNGTLYQNNLMPNQRIG